MEHDEAFESWMHEATIDKLWSHLPDGMQEELIRLVSYVAKEFGEQHLLPDV